MNPNRRVLTPRGKTDNTPLTPKDIEEMRRRGDLEQSSPYRPPAIPRDGRAGLTINDKALAHGAGNPSPNRQDEPPEIITAYETNPPQHMVFDPVEGKYRTATPAEIEARRAWEAHTSKDMFTPHKHKADQRSKKSGKASPLKYKAKK